MARCTRSIGPLCVRTFVALCSFAFTAVVSGCGIGVLSPTNALPDIAFNGAALHGTTHGGQQPVTGAHVYLFAAGTGGYGTAATSMLTAQPNTAQDATGYYVTTDANGAFNITNDYPCPSPSAQMYILSKGGSPAAGITNNAIALLAALGPCSSLNGSTSIVINELTTVAAAYALANFATDATHIASPNTPLAIANIAQAFATANNLVPYNTGLAVASTANNAGVVPFAEINTMANIIATCVNSSDQTSTCQTVEVTVTPSLVTIPSDTFGIARYFSKYPSNNPSGSFALGNSVSPFQPTLATPPNDWTIAVYYPLPATGVPGRLAIDADGSLWVPVCQANCSGSRPGLVHHVSNLGVTLSGTGHTIGVNKAPYVAAIDLAGKVWVGYTGGISRLDTNGSVSTGFPVNNSSLLNIVDLAIDGSTNVWGANSGSPNNDVVLFSGTTGFPTNSFSFTSQFYNPGNVAVDSAGVLWATGQCTAACTNGVSARLLRISAPNSNATKNYYDVGVGGINTSLVGLSILAGRGTVTWGQQTQQTYITTSTGASSGGLSAPGSDTTFTSMTQDGLGGVYISSNQNSKISATQNARITPGPTALLSPALTLPGSLAADGAGNLWTVGCYAVSTSCLQGLGNQNALFEFVGLAYPTITPLVAATSTNTQGTRP